MKKIIFLLLICTSAFAQNPYEQYKKDWVGKTAPDFEFQSITGQSYKLSDLKGKIVLLNFWFTSCSGCRIEYPGLQTLKNRFNEDIPVVFLSLANDEQERLENYLSKNPLNFEHMASATDIGLKKYQILGYPTNLLIDQNGVISHIKVGGSKQSADDIEYEIKQLLK